MSDLANDIECLPMDLTVGGQADDHKNLARLFEKAYSQGRKYYEIGGLHRKAEKDKFHLGPAMYMTVEEKLTHSAEPCRGLASCWYVFNGQLWIKGVWHLQQLPGYVSITGSFRELHIKNPDDNTKFIEVTNMAGPWWKMLRRDVQSYLEQQLDRYEPVIPWDGKEGIDHLMEQSGQQGGVSLAADRGEISANEILAELNQLVGLDQIKAHVREHVAFLQVQQKRKACGKKIPEISLHSIFAGPPGTGKTTVAQIMGRIYHQLGFLETDKVTVAGLNDLTGSHMGQTSDKIVKLVESALGGVLLIDEAYALNDGGGRYKGYGAEAINTLLPLIEKHKNQLVVIMAGYDEQMNELLAINPGISSRFTNRFDFAPYAGAELSEIFLRMAENDDYTFALDDLEKLIGYFDNVVADSDAETFGNARYVRNLYQQVITAQASRVINSADEAETNELTFEDLPLAAASF